MTYSKGTSFWLFVYLECAFWGPCVSPLRAERATSEGRVSAVTDPSRLVNEVLLSPAVPTVPLTKLSTGSFESQGCPWREHDLAELHFYWCLSIWVWKWTSGQAFGERRYEEWHIGVRGMWREEEPHLFLGKHDNLQFDCMSPSLCSFANFRWSPFHFYTPPNLF